MEIRITLKKYPFSVSNAEEATAPITKYQNEFQAKSSGFRDAKISEKNAGIIMKARAITNRKPPMRAA